MAKLINTTIKLRRDNDYNYNRVADSFIPMKGEPVLVDTEQYGLRFKIGDGVTPYGALAYADDNNNVVLLGYYLNSKFYTDSTYTVELEKSESKLYIDKNAHAVYIWNGENYIPLSPEATETVAGMMKLYQTSGNNTDGTMSQKVITEGVNAIKFELDGQDKECLVLDLPWD